MAKLNKKEWTLLNTHNIINILFNELDLSDKEVRAIFNKILISRKFKKEKKFF